MTAAAEALFARGFTSAADVTGLSPADFAWAMIGTPAYVHAAAIHTKAGDGGGPPVLPPGTFHPINPDGRLVDCVPPPELSPLGTVAHLHALLGVSTNAKCDPPAACDALDPAAPPAPRAAPVPKEPAQPAVPAQPTPPHTVKKTASMK